MHRNSPFSYVCNACGLCCHNKVITLSPYDVLRLARAAGISTREAIDRFTIRRGSILKFTDGGACVALEGTRCGVHRGRPLACRLYPLGIERIEDADGEKFVMLEPAVGSLGVYGVEGDVDRLPRSAGCRRVSRCECALCVVARCLSRAYRGDRRFRSSRAARVLASRRSRGSRRVELRRQSI